MRKCSESHGDAACERGGQCGRICEEAIAISAIADEKNKARIRPRGRIRQWLPQPEDARQEFLRTYLYA